MVMKSKTISRVMSFFRIPLDDIERWRTIRASDVLAIPGCGKSMLNKLRLYLAHRGVNLRDDNPPAYWLEALTPKPDDSEPSGSCPFTVIVDHNETFPFTFEGITDSDDRPVSVPIMKEQMWREGLADYSIVGMKQEIQIERKSLEDLVSTLSMRRESFEDEIARLDGGCEFAAIVCESPWSEVLQDTHDHGARAKSISRTYLSWVIRYPGVHWIMCAGRYHAEHVTYRLLEKFWWSKQRDMTNEFVAGHMAGLFEKV